MNKKERVINWVKNLLINESRRAKFAERNFLEYPKTNIDYADYKSAVYGRNMAEDVAAEILADLLPDNEDSTRFIKKLIDESMDYGEKVGSKQYEDYEDERKYMLYKAHLA